MRHFPELTSSLPLVLPRRGRPEEGQQQHFHQMMALAYYQDELGPPVATTRDTEIGG
jgi:hypothetical protein